MSLEGFRFRDHTARVRFAPAAVLSALLLATTAAAATTSTYAATRSCLAAAGGKFDSAHTAELIRFPEEKQILYWISGRDSKGKPNDVSIYFTVNAAAAGRLQQRFVKLGESFGFPDALVKAHMGKLGNVVWVSDVTRPTITGTKIALLKRCLG